MQIWNYNRDTGELFGPGVADPNPLELGNWLVPAHATTIAPPAPKAGTAHTFDGNAWASIADHRGETWWPTTQPFNNVPGVVVGFLGDPAAQGLTKTEPPEAPPAPAAATPHQLFTALATAMGIAPDKIDALAELAKTL